MHSLRAPRCGCFVVLQSQRKYIPLLQVEAHTTLQATTSRTVLTQTFSNPSKQQPLDELRYIFPLYDGVSVVAFTCTVGDKIIRGVVEERQKAKQVYDAAIAAGQTAGLLAQSLDTADVFQTTVGNVPAGETVKVELIYLGELKHDAETDGLRFTIPTHIAPRFGTWETLMRPGIDDNVRPQGGLHLTVDVDMPEGFAVKSVQSPSDPISVSIGSSSTSKPDDAPSLQKASATLALGKAELNSDFVLQVAVARLGEPSAVLETHPTLPNQRAIMATLVPKFTLPAEKPEIVFVCDRSGSMGGGGKIPNLIAALKTFLKSLPVGVKFNICSFGSDFSFLWPKSKTYNRETLDEAVRHVSTFQCNMGGTYMYEPLKQTFAERYQDMNLEVFLLTDGDITDQENLFRLIDKNVSESDGAIRVFSLGIGRDASTALIEGAARAGNGFSQSVGDSERMDKKVIRMLKGALLPHIKDYSLEIKYGSDKQDKPTDDDDDEFELVEKVMDALTIEPVVETSSKEPEQPKKPISLFDTSNDGSQDTEMQDAPVDTKYNHLPKVPVPRYLQAPFKVPALYPFNRTTVYVMLSDDTPSREPLSVVLRGTAPSGPLELEIPITKLPEPGTTIHQLAARKAVRELEDGRGWLVHAKDAETGKLLKERYEGRFSDMVEQEAVRLGLRYQIAGKWCSFVAVEDGKVKPDGIGPDPEPLSSEESIPRPGKRMMTRYAAASIPPPPPALSTQLFGYSSSVPSTAPPPPGAGSGLFSTSHYHSATRARYSAGPSDGGFGGALPQTPYAAPMAAASIQAQFAAPASSSGGVFQSMTGTSPFSSLSSPLQSGDVLNDFDFDSFLHDEDGGNSPFGSNGPFDQTVQAAALAPPAAAIDEKLLEQYQREMESAACMPLPDELLEDEDEAMGFALFDDGPSTFADMAYSSLSKPQAADAKNVGAAPSSARTLDRREPTSPPAPTPAEPLAVITELQSFEGSWSWDPRLEEVLGVSKDEAIKAIKAAGFRAAANEGDNLTTAAVVAFLKKKLIDDEDVWEMMAEKALLWLGEQLSSEDEANKVVDVLQGLF
jgi:hypothetical protein